MGIVLCRRAWFTVGAVAPLPTQVVLLADHEPENQAVSSTLHGFYFRFLLEFLPWHPSIEAGEVELLVK